MRREVDVVVLGMGPGGEHAANRLAAAGLDVVGVEAELVGGECPYWGCVPSKMMIRAANLLAEARRIPGTAGQAEVKADWKPVATRIREEATDDWDDTAAVQRFTDKGGELVRGHGRLAGPRTVQVDDLVLAARRGVVLATGAVPQLPPVPGLADVPYWTHREAIRAEHRPDSLLVLGGGAIGLELAQVLARFGTEVTVVEAAQRLLPGEEPEAGTVLAGVLRSDGLRIRVGRRAVSAAYRSGASVLSLEDGEELTAQRLLVATGRRPDLSRLGLDTVGLDPKAQRVTVDGQMLAAPGLWAVGDLTGRGPFTHVALYQAELAARAVLGRPGPPADYRALPRVTFTDPEVASVGLTEAAARERGLRVRTGSADIPKAARGWIHGPGNAGVVKLVEDADRGVLVGATAVAPTGGEVLYGLAVAVHAEVPVDRLQQMILAYPTFHRAVEHALAALHEPNSATIGRRGFAAAGQTGGPEVRRTWLY
ncbi:NAD(P)/FAD-dependent oxidoreductase [Streptomyces sp. CB01881]|uniref:dihydrolipoyl dehydrogenase family protein n=1 Tax=Streptomyces sp. CB01881 TaxID=2078691 RepID=UPI000CDBC560|nr:NAD(P)/FAD-dependent oxidoreductase [Streptomyces sp. CB01881]AUY47906.1 pyridine nucleotide-disulfide oxidoreductase [Streptomyces sp. CB01881]TYC76381.1 NAD(P)/FAD-dependent oxidoreductase [Streptomyces sp. CB01881]